MDLFDEDLIDGEVFLFSKYGIDNLEPYLDGRKLDFNYTESSGSIFLNDFGIIDNANKEVYSHHYVAALPEKYEGGNEIKDSNKISHLYRTNSKVGSYKIVEYGKTLYIWMGKTDFYDDNELLDFCSKWGIPCGGNLEEEIFTKKRSLAFIAADIALEVIELVNSFKSIFTSYTKVFYEDDIEWYIKNYPHKMFGTIDEIPEKEISDLIESVNSNVDKRSNALARAKRYITYDLENNLSFDVQLRLNDSSSKSQIYINFKNLVEISFYYLGKAILEKAELRRCAHCNHYFEVTDNRQRFCPPPPTHKRSICETAYNNKRKREMKKSNPK